MNCQKTRDRFLIAAVAVGLFGGVYELFSHQVYSGYMILAFLWPFLGGVLPYSVWNGLSRPWQPDALAGCLINSGLAALTAGSLFQGVLEIYGTTSRLSAAYWITGAVLVLAGMTAYGFQLRRLRQD